MARSMSEFSTPSRIHEGRVRPSCCRTIRHHKTRPTLMAAPADVQSLSPVHPDINRMATLIIVAASCNALPIGERRFEPLHHPEVNLLIYKEHRGYYSQIPYGECKSTKAFLSVRL